MMALNFLEILNSVDDDIVEKAAETGKIRKIPWTKVITIAACLAVCIVAVISARSIISKKNVSAERSAAGETEIFILESTSEETSPECVGKAIPDGNTPLLSDKESEKSEESVADGSKITSEAFNPEVKKDGSKLSEKTTVPGKVTDDGANDVYHSYPEENAPVKTTTAVTEETTKGTKNTKPVQSYHAYTGTTIIDTFIVKEVHGTNLVLARYDRNNGEYKEGLYSCNLGELDGSADMKYNVGDVVTVRYDQEIAETYPYQITVREIYPAVWN